MTRFKALLRIILLGWLEIPQAISFVMGRSFQWLFDVQPRYLLRWEENGISVLKDFKILWTGKK